MRNRIKSLFFVLFALLCVGLFNAAPAPLYAASGNFDVTPGVIFSAIKAQTNDRTVTITNTTGAAIQITGLSSNNAKFAPVGVSLPLNIGGNSSAQVTVRFSPDAEGVETGVLTVTGTGGSETVQLRGLGTDGSGGNNEPSLQLIFDAWGIGLSTGDDDKFSTTIHSTVGIASQPMIPGSGEISAPAFQRVNAAQPVTMQVLALYGVNSTPDVRVGTYTPGDPDSKDELFTIDCCGGQTLAPPVTGQTSFSPSGSFSFYSVWPGFSNRVVYQESFLNDWEGNVANRYKYRIYPFPGEANAYIYAVEEYNSGFDYNDIVVIVRNVAPTTSTGSPGITFENLDWATLNGLNVSGFGWMNRWMTFSKLRDPATGLRVHDTVTLRIRNTGTSPITVSNIKFDDPSNWVTNKTLPFNIPVNGHQDVTVQYIEASTYSGARFGKMFITSNAPNEPFAIINLGAGYQQKKEGQDEPQAQTLIDAFGFKSVIGRIPAGSYFPAGEEIMSKYWYIADTSKPVYVRQLAAFHGCCGAADSVRLRLKSNNSTIIGQFSHDARDGQSNLPLKNNSPTPAEMILPSLTPSQVFMMEVAGKVSCEPGDNVCSGNNLHGMRIWPVRDPQGKFIPNAYIFSMDFVGNPSVNYDYNDNVYLITNIKPEIQDQPDLVTTVNSNTPATVVGAVSTFRFDVRNIKPFVANNVNFTINLPANATFVSQSNPQCNRNGQQINCNFGSNFLNNDQTVFVALQTASGETLPVSTTLTTSTSEIRTNNNNVSMSLPILSAPQAQNDAYAAQPDAALTVDSFNGVLTNDFYATALTSAVYGAPRNGSVTLNADGSFVYTPNAGFNGQDSFTYVVSGTDGTADLGTVNVTVGSAALNLLADGNFEAKQDGIDSGWKIQNGSKDKFKCSKPNKSAVSYEGECAFAFNGGAGENTKLSQNIKSDALVAGQTLALSGMFKAEALPEGAAQVRVKVVYADGTKDKQSFDLAGGSYDYTAFAQDIAITGAVKKVKLSITFKGETGSLWADFFSATVGGLRTGEAGFGTSDTLGLPEAAPGFGSNQP